MQLNELQLELYCQASSYEKTGVVLPMSKH